MEIALSRYALRGEPNQLEALRKEKLSLSQKPIYANYLDVKGTLWSCRLIPARTHPPVWVRKRALGALLLRVDSEGLKPAALSVSHHNNYSKMFYRCCNNNATVSAFHLEWASSAFLHVSSFSLRQQEWYECPAILILRVFHRYFNYQKII